MKKFIILFLWFLSLVASVIWSYENPEKVERLKDYFKNKKNHEIKIAEDPSKSSLLMLLMLI